MGKEQSRTRLALLIAFLSAFYLSDFAGAYVVIDPYAAGGTMIRHPLFDQYFMDQLYADGVVPVISNGSVDFYIAEKGRCVQADGEKCTAVLCGDAICGSDSYQGDVQGSAIDTAFLTGNNETHEAITARNALRYSAGNSVERMSVVENNIAAIDGTNLDMVYLQNRYDSSVKNLIGEKILNEPGLEGLNTLLKKGDTQGAINLLDRHFAENYNISPAYDFYDLYTAVNQRTIGPVQYSEIMNTILGEYGQNQSIGDLLNQSGILNTTMGQDAVNQAINELSNHPEWISELEKSMNQMDEKIFNDMVSKALQETFKNKEMLKNYLDVLSKAMDNKKVRDMFLSASAEAIRQMQASGELDKLLDGLKDNNIKQQIMDQVRQSAPSALDRIVDGIKSNIEWKYVLPIVGLIVIAAVSLRTGL